ncbi:hypothetical protein UVI_02034900 [Ustilaginoidea virens]|nr:hypothetical protein UVI_02034900 [Ustilaginoidea virens]
MLQKPIPHSFFSIKHEAQCHRPTSVVTEFVDTDWDEELLSDFEDNSPRTSLQSSGQPSFTTVSSYDEALTPRSSRGQESYPEVCPLQVQGPRGPHLFRALTDPSPVDEDVVLTLSPITPKIPGRMGGPPVRPQTPRSNGQFQYTDAELALSNLSSWTPEMVAQSMLNAGVGLLTADRFIENDINGAILVTLKFEDLRELDIQSFGIRTKVWHQIQILRESRPPSPRMCTPIEDDPGQEARVETVKKPCENGVKRHRSSKQRPRRKPLGEEDIVHPMESVSIIGIEQVVPKAHHCSKGENCSKWRRQQRLIEQFKELHPAADVKNGGTVMIYGDAGNPETARAIDPNETLRPLSDAVPSVVASSDVLGPGGLRPLQYLQEATLRNVQARDAQYNVRQFLNFQQGNANSGQVPPTPPFELMPATKPPHHGLRYLPKLSIPNQIPQPRGGPLREAAVSHQADSQHQAPQVAQQKQSPHHLPKQPVRPTGFTPYRMDKAAPLSPDLEPCRNPYRFGSPFSELDVPVLTAVPMGPVTRNVSQSVPPDMSYRAAPATNTVTRARSQSRASSRRPSFSLLAAVNENTDLLQLGRTPSPESAWSPVRRVEPPQQQQAQQQAQLQNSTLAAPPRFNYPWSPAGRTRFEHALPPLSTLGPGQPNEATATGNGLITCQGPMKKRKTRLLRHEWLDGYFTLKGTRLHMHKDIGQQDRTLEYIDIDDYAIACSSLASTSKLSAAFKAVHLSHKREKSEPVGAFSFQLIPQDKNASTRLRKRDSSMSGTSGTSGNGCPSEGANGTGKTHHFAVKNRDERIDWMRELMLAKAMKQKGEGFEISVNGNMI